MGNTFPSNSYLCYEKAVHCDTLLRHFYVPTLRARDKVQQAVIISNFPHQRIDAQDVSKPEERRGTHYLELWTSIYLLTKSSSNFDRAQRARRAVTRLAAVIVCSLRYV